MYLSTLLKDFSSAAIQTDCDITHLTLDSRQVISGSLFFACMGTQLDGKQFINDAIERGAKAILVDAKTDTSIINKSVPIIPIEKLQQVLGLIASRFYDFPARQLQMIGVTGTNGKTSCTHFIAQLLEMLHTPCGIMGTLGNGFYGALGTAGLTTPDAITLQSILNDFVHQHAKAIAMEVSSHSIDQGRVNGIEFDTGIFTNLTQDHLDYHGDMQTYAAVKKRFFSEWPMKHLVINADDEYGVKWIHELANTKSIWAYGTTKNNTLPKHVPYIYAENIESSLNGIRATLHTPWGISELQVSLIGLFNLSNILAVLTALCANDAPFASVIQKLSSLKSVPGRMQTLGGENKPLVVVDYSHTPDALEKVLQALRAHTQGKLICVFGCGGDRDKSKRPLMAKIAERWADQVIVTNDNPRHENPEAIAEQIKMGFSKPEKISVILDRSQAIEKSIQLATVNDCVLIAGKGAETYQQIGDKKIPFDDRVQAQQILGEV